jgi:hypothetical protein
MSISISSSFPSASFTAANTSTNVHAAPPTQTTTNDSATIVHLSLPQQVSQLNHQGQSVPEIASNLSLSIGIVNSYLGISPTK